MRGNLSTWYEMMTGTMPPAGDHTTRVQLRAVKALNGMVYGAVALITAGVVLVAYWAVTGTGVLLTAGYWLIGVSWAELIILGAAAAAARVHKRHRGRPGRAA